MKLRILLTLMALTLVSSCAGPVDRSSTQNPVQTVASTPTRAQAADGQYISWKEHLVDDEAIGGVPIRGGDGLAIADLDRDGFIDIVSVHESDTNYGGVADGHIRIAFGSESPDGWELITLAEGSEAGAAEDVAIGDINGDGFPDIVAACELAHLIYFQNPGTDIRGTRWERVIPPVASDRGSFIRVFLADFNKDGWLEVVAANKGGQNPPPDTTDRHPISWFEIPQNPLDGSQWVEHELTRVIVPINSQPVDLDSDEDMDVLGGTRGESRILWFENAGGEDVAFEEHAIEIAGGSTPPVVTGFNLDFVDFSGDGRLDIVLKESRSNLVWLKQPTDSPSGWTLHSIGDVRPDMLVGFVVSDINEDGLPDVMTGSYSQGRRDRDGDDTPLDSVGRLAWFEHPGDPAGMWKRHDISRRKRGMYDKFIARDMDGDGDIDFLSTRGNSTAYDGVFWLEQVRSSAPTNAFQQAREIDSMQLPLPHN